MPKVGMEPIRRAALVEATIAEIGQSGSLDVTVGAISKRAGMSSGLAHHYFGGKDQIFQAAMRHILQVFGREVRTRLACANTPRERLEAIVSASFAAQNFQPDVINAWLNFYVQAQTNADVLRLLKVYHRRLRSNLLHELRKISGPKAPEISDTVAALIDGLYIRASFGDLPDPARAAQTVLDVIDLKVQ